MSDFFKDFTIPSLKDWQAKITKDLKGKDFEESMTNNYPLEEISYNANYHYSTSQVEEEYPGTGDYKRGGRFDQNSWEIMAEVPSDLDAKAQNTYALNALMKGNTALRLDFGNFSLEECKTVVENIGFEHIHAFITVNNEEQFSFAQEIANQTENKVRILSKNSVAKNICIDAREVLVSGGNSTQEIAYALHRGHEELHLLIENGVSVDNAAACIHFKLGIGNLYFLEIAKFRVLRKLWSFIVEQYQPEHACSKVATIEAQSIDVNKSVKDPYTNLLRLTTECLSAAVGGADFIVVRPYDQRATQKRPEFTQRMANNISLILKEESYIDKVIDPAGGAYALEAITEVLEKNVWKRFQALENGEMDTFVADVNAIRAQRIASVEAKKNTLIGINKFPNITDEDNTWQAAEKTVFGSELILERDAKVEL
ncbi:methylmalonyl-CoA mutase family protein [Lishizhenia sp.]|uniref:methylmalonyl-CoA mutase family protein n=1 Tax=Lishizhenia sp. TaxID=2497594 RepID=UPI00299DDD0D|nr:methylmalonyl-CoA mutase family protein [Lishizhenia sp.]MDX1446925.1 methylmalonyl-CoA mutase family protein [Lishizhenia sp.]